MCKPKHVRKMRSSWRMNLAVEFTRKKSQRMGTLWRTAEACSSTFVVGALQVHLRFSLAVSSSRREPYVTEHCYLPKNLLFRHKVDMGWTMGQPSVFQLFWSSVLLAAGIERFVERQCIDVWELVRPGSGVIRKGIQFDEVLKQVWFSLYICNETPLVCSSRAPHTGSML